LPSFVVECFVLFLIARFSSTKNNWIPICTL
jgi:hypothetical protein